jgi:hypothetical protein
VIVETEMHRYHHGDTLKPILTKVMKIGEESEETTLPWIERVQTGTDEIEIGTMIEGMIEGEKIEETEMILIEEMMTMIGEIEGVEGEMTEAGIGKTTMTEEARRRTGATQEITTGDLQRRMIETMTESQQDMMKGREMKMRCHTLDPLSR